MGCSSKFSTRERCGVRQTWWNLHLEIQAEFVVSDFTRTRWWLIEGDLAEEVLNHPQQTPDLYLGALAIRLSRRRA